MSVDKYRPLRTGTMVGSAEKIKEMISRQESKKKKSERSSKVL